MMNFKSLIVFTAILSGCTNKIDKIEGQWEYVGEAESKYDVECPEIIHFHPDKKYEIFNDCYGVDYRNPLMESGLWEFSKQNNIISLKQRKFYTSHVFQDSNNSMRLFVKKVNEGFMHVAIGGDNTNATEVYRRRK